MTLDRFIAAFEVLSAELHVENLLDAIWLAQLDRKLILGETAIGAPVAVPNSAETKLTEDGRKPDSEITDVTEPERVEQNSASELSEMTPVYAPGAAEPASSTIKASSVAIPAGHALPGRLHFTRAMRPFSRKWPSRPESELDEERTVEVTADLGLDLYPIFRPVQEHWFDVDVVLEDDPAVLVWQDTLRDFCQLLRDTGAFRDVRRWRLHLEGKQPMLESLPGGGRSSVRVLNGIGIRRLVFFATHGSSPHWNDGVYAGILGGWRTESSIVVLQMQPRHRWKRSALGEAQGTAFALEPGVPTSALRVQAYWWSLAATEEEGTLVSVPVVPLAPSAISEWAQMQMARGRRCPAIFLDKDSSDNGVTSLLRSGPTGSATRLLKLLGESSPEAYRLAIYLASGPFTIPVARLVQEAMFAAAADQAHLADVLLCGCVAPRVGQESEADPNRIYYEFTPEARSILLRSLHEADAQQITQSLQDFVSRYIEQIYGRVITFKALVPDENGNYELPDWAQPFAKLGVSLLGLPAHGKSVRQLVQDFRSANVPAVVGEAARFARTGAKPRQNLARELVSAGLARRIPTGIEWLPGVETLLKEIPPLTGASILWVDDHPENILTAARRIREAGAAIHEVLSTGSAIEVLKNAAFDVIITDMTRGVQTTEGLDLIIQLKVQAIQAPVIIYTGKFAETGQDAARMVGAFGCTNDADALFGLIIEALTPGTERDTGTLDYQPEASEAILRAPGDRHTTFVNLLWVIKAYCNSAVNQLFVLQYGELVVVADVIDADKRRYVVASWEGIIGRAARERRPVWVNDVLVDADYIAAEPSSRSECVIPLLSDGEVLGVLNVEFTRANALTQQQVDWLVKFSQPLAAAIAVARRPRMLFVGRDQHLSRRIVTDLGRQGIQVEGLSSPDESLSPFTPVLLPISPASVERVRVATTWLRASWLIPLLLEDIPLPQALSAFVPFDFTRDYDAVFPELAKTLLLGGARAGSVAEALPNKVEQTPKPADITIEVPFATNRREQSDGGYGADRGELSYGVCTVNVPPVHRLGQLEQRSILRLEFRDNPEKHFMLVGLRRTPDLSQNDDRVLIFIHDWNMTLEGAVLRFAQIVYDLAADVTPILFSWPSQGQVTGYVADLQSADASAQQLSRVLASFTRSRSLALWAHGAGCRALLGALRDSAVTADHILFTMPDADEAWFRENMRVAQATRARVRETLAEAESHSATRVRLNGANEDRATANWIVATYRHDTSRELDPQLHTHAVAANLTYDGVEGRWKALQASGLYERRAYLTEVYRNALAREVRDLGYEIEPRRDSKGKDHGFEIRGVSNELLEKYSVRSAQRDAAIERFTVEHGRKPTDNEVAVLVRESRADKLAEIATEKVREQQQSRLAPEEKHTLQHLRSDSQEQTPRVLHEPSRAIESLQFAKEHLFERNSVVRDHELMAEALRHGRGQIDPGELRGALEVEQAQGGLIRAGNNLATRQSLEREQRMIAVVGRGIGRYERMGGEREFHPSERLREEQQRAVHHVLDSRDFAVNLRGAAGTGKTATLHEIDRGLRDAGREIVAVAPTRSAVDELRKVGFHDAMTISRLLEASTERPSLLGRVLVVDEAGMVSGRQMEGLLKLAEREGARILFSGDTRQIQSVEASDALRILERESQMKSVSLTGVQRQTQADYRDAIQTLRQAPEQGFQKLEQLGAIREVPYLERPQAVASAYRELTTDPSRKVLVVAGTHEEIGRITHAIREGMKQSGDLGPGKIFERHTPLQWTEAQKKDLSNYQQGQVLLFHRSSHGIDRNEALVVERSNTSHIITKDQNGIERMVSPTQARSFSVHERSQIEISPGDRLLLTGNRREADFRATNGELVKVRGVDGGRIQLEDGRTLPANYRDFDHGYAITAHRSQGKTVDSVVLSGDMMKQEQFYVAASRGRDGIAVITSNVDQLRESLGISSARPSATELAREQDKIQPAQEHGVAHPPMEKIEQPIPRNEIALGHDIGMGF